MDLVFHCDSCFQRCWLFLRNETQTSNCPDKGTDKALQLPTGTAWHNHPPSPGNTKLPCQNRHAGTNGCEGELQESEGKRTKAEVSMHFIVINNGVVGRDSCSEIPSEAMSGPLFRMLNLKLPLNKSTADTCLKQNKGPN